MSLPPAIRAEVEAAFAELGEGGIADVLPVGGGCISPAARIETGSGGVHFLKWAVAGSVPRDFFSTQADGLRAIAAAGAVRVPGVTASGPGWLLLEWLDPGHAGRDTWPALGRQLAAVHRMRGPAFGWEADNYIGSLPQSNSRGPSWPAFYAARRLGRQWDRARRAGFFDASDETAFRKLLGTLDDLLSPGDEDGPSLVHGDLWGGNVHIMADGNAALVDPATYHGHREVDLAMAELFGGFDRVFFQAYREAWPLHPGYEEDRRALYQLYFVLVHVNLFGHSYVGGARRVLQRFRP